MLDPVERVWQTLAAAREVRFRARWTDGCGDDRRGEGRGSVTVAADGEAGARRLTVLEEGWWEPEPGTALRFRARHRWTRMEGGLRLEHLRRGRHRPVFLAELVPVHEGGLGSRRPHLCGADRYRARVRLGEGSVSLTWRVRGPSKTQRLKSEYR